MMLLIGTYSGRKKKLSNSTVPTTDAEKNPHTGKPISGTVYTGSIVDADIDPEISWKVDQEGAETVESYLYHERADGSRQVLSGANLGGVSPDHEFTANVLAAWEADTPLVKLVLVTTITFPDGSETVEETVFYKYVQPTAAFMSELADGFSQPDEPWFESSDLHFRVYTDHNKTVDERALVIGLQRFDIVDGGTQFITLQSKAGTHDAYAFASFLDGTSSKSNVIPITVQGGISPALKAELEAVVDRSMSDTLTGPHATNLHTINQQIQPGVDLFNAGQPWMLGQHTKTALTAERDNWQAIYDDPDVSDSTKAMADSAIQNLGLIIQAAQLSAAAYSPPIDLNGAFVATATMQNGITQYFDWIRSVPNTPFIMSF